MTFAPNFWKGERDIRRANLERLYSALHKYTHELSLIGIEVRMGSFSPTEDRSEFKAQFELISVLINLYFPRLKADFESLRDRNEEFLLKPPRDHTRFEEEYLAIVAEGENLKDAVASLAHELEMFPG